MLQVTPSTSLKQRGRTAELPRPDFNRQVIRFTRHTLQVNKKRHNIIDGCQVESEDKILGANNHNSFLGKLNIRKTEFYIKQKRPQNMARLS